uniref:Uncharacterized protein n=1 Tax=Araucaria cunninghamii TaxID=56994 RepID=A0A0D6R9P9_ARACU
MEGLATRVLVGSPTLHPLQFRTKPKPTHSLPSLKFPRSLPIPTKITTRASLRFTHSTTFQVPKSLALIHSPQANLRTKICCFFSRRSQGQAPKEEDRPKAKLGWGWLLVISVAFALLNFQGPFCRPALAAWDILPAAFTIRLQIRKLGRALKRLDRKMGKKEREKVRAWLDSVEPKIKQEMEEYLSEKPDPQLVEPKAKEVTQELVEAFPDLEPKAEGVENTMKEVYPYLESVGEEELVGNMAKLGVYIWVKAGDFKRAVKILDRMIEREPSKAQWIKLKEGLLKYAARREMKANRPQAAREYFEEFLELQPFNARVLQELAVAMHKIGQDAAMVNLVKERVQQAKKVKSEKDVYNMKLLLGNVYIVQGNLEEALKQYERLTRENPNDYKAYLAQGIIYSVLDRKDEAEEQFEKYYKVVPDSVPHEAFLDNIVVEAMAQGRKFFKEEKKEQLLRRRGKIRKALRRT